MGTKIVGYASGKKRVTDMKWKLNNKDIKIFKP